MSGHCLSFLEQIGHRTSYKTGRFSNRSWNKNGVHCKIHLLCVKSCKDLENVGNNLVFLGARLPVSPRVPLLELYPLLTEVTDGPGGVVIVSEAHVE